MKSTITQQEEEEDDDTINSNFTNEKRPLFVLVSVLRVVTVFDVLRVAKNSTVFFERTSLFLKIILLLLTAYYCLVKSLKKIQ